MFDDDSDYSRPSLSPFAMIGTMTTAMVPMMLLSTMAPFILYIVARWRDARSPAPDPQLGLKFALCFFRLQGYQILLVGTTMLLFSILMKGEGRFMSEIREMIYRPAFGLIVPGAIVFGVASSMLPRTNQAEYPNVGRLFAGYNLMMVGMVGFAALVMLFVLMFQKGDMGQAGRVAWSAVLVYTTAWVVQAITFAKYVFERPPPSSLEPPSSPPPPPAPPSDLPGPMQKPLA